MKRIEIIAMMVVLIMAAKIHSSTVSAPTAPA
jgi:hypothetical protein